MKIHPLNAKGRYYVDQDTCTCNAACEYIAPNFYAIDNADYGAYIYKQPENAVGEEQARKGMNVCPVEAIQDDGETNNL